MTAIEQATNALIPIPDIDTLKAADEAQLLTLLDWLGRWTREIDTELKLRFPRKPPRQE